MRRRYTGPPQQVVEACLERASYSCEINGCDLVGNRGEGWSLQHRRSRGSGGTLDARANLPSNLLVVCGSGTTDCHGLIENGLRGAAYEVGWLIRKCVCSDPWKCEHSPRKRVALILRTRWVYLDDAANYIDTEPPPVEVA